MFWGVLAGALLMGIFLVTVIVFNLDASTRSGDGAGSSHRRDGAG
jgi:hypothetical protein